MFPKAVLLLSLFALIATKIADIVTTWRGLRVSGVDGEQNPLARRAMAKLGPAGGIAFVMVLWCAVLGICYLSAWFSSSPHQWAMAAAGFLVAWAQWDVARCNATGRSSWFTRRASAAFRFAGRLIPAHKKWK